MGYYHKYKQYVYRHMYPKKSTALFTYHKYPDGKGDFLDDGFVSFAAQGEGQS